MRKTELAVVTFALILFFLVGPLTAKRNENMHREEARQEEQAEEEIIDQQGESYRVVYRPTGLKENSVADILWLKKAAEIAMDAGIPHFNVRKKKIVKEFNRRLQRKVNVVEGTIVLDNDPMKAEYDAHEILSLVLPEINQ